MKKIILTGSLFLMLSLQGVNAEQVLKANRHLCSPQSADMMQDGYFTSYCDWAQWFPGDDTNPVITLNGMQPVYAECEFFGHDAIAYVQGTKHAKIDRLVLPGNQFNFMIEYDDYASRDDNQNIIFYLNTKNPDFSNQLVCHFYNANYIKVHK